MALALVATTACDSTTEPSGPQTVAIEFMPMIGSQAFSCGTSYPGVGTSGSTVKVNDFRLFVSDVKAIMHDGTEHPVTLTQDGSTQLGSVALLDFEDGTNGCVGTSLINRALEGVVSEGGHIHGFKFTLGIPPTQNHGDASAAAAPLNTTSMFWSWNLGYMFFKADLVTSGRPGGWFAHLGSTGCTSATPGSATCTEPNRVQVTLNDFDPTNRVVVIDLKQLLAASNVDAESGGAPGCMSFPTDGDCGPLLPRFGIGSTQQLFRVASK
jgi:uncharacterized repeat protein (TIGR04052 family)